MEEQNLFVQGNTLLARLGQHLKPQVIEDRIEERGIASPVVVYGLREYHEHFGLADIMNSLLRARNGEGNFYVLEPDREHRKAFSDRFFEPIKGHIYNDLGSLTGVPDLRLASGLIEIVYAHQGFRVIAHKQGKTVLRPSSMLLDGTAKLFADGLRKAIDISDEVVLDMSRLKEMDGYAAMAIKEQSQYAAASGKKLEIYGGHPEKFLGVEGDGIYSSSSGY